VVLQIALCLSWLVPGTARPVEIALSGSHIIRTWQTEDGLPQNTITTLLQSHDGYLWIGTYNGLARFDGVQFTVFNNSKRPELPNDRITSLFEGDDGTLWIGHATGEITSYKNGRFTAQKLPMNWSGKKISSVATDEDGDVWLLNEDGLLARLRDGFTLLPEGGIANKLVDMTRSPTGAIWVARDGRVSRLSHGQLTPLDFPEASTNTFVMGIGAGRTGGLWIIADGMLRKRDGKSWVFDGKPAPTGTSPVHNLTETKNHLLIAGTSEHGFYVFNPENDDAWQFSRANGFPSDWVISAAEDREGEFWVGTGGGGLAMVRDGICRQPKPPDQWQNRPVLSVFAARTGDVWVGTEGAGLYRDSNDHWDHFDEDSGFNNAYVWSLAEDSEGNLWAGTWGGGLYLRQGDQFVPAPGLQSISDPMPALLPARDGGLWIGSASGVIRYQHGEAKRLEASSTNSPAYPDVRAIREDMDGGLWFGMSGSGLAHCDKNGNIKQFRKGDGLSSDSIECLHFDNEGTLWIGTSGGGLDRFKNGSFSVIDKKNGLPNEVISHIEEDGQGFFWMSSHAGIIRASQAELNRCADGTITNARFMTFGINDGLPTVECSGGLQPSGCKTSDGRLWFPTSKGLVTVDPHNVKINPLPPPVTIEELQVDDHETNIGGDTVTIQPGRHRFEFQYTALSFIAPEKVRFKCRLEGAETEWTDEGTKRSVNFNYIPPGHYTFHVIACNNDDVWNETGASIGLIVRPFFWQTVTFRICGGIATVLISGGIVWFSMRRRMQQKLERLESQRAVEQERARIAHDIHDDLGSHLTRITMLSESARGELDTPTRATADINQIYDTARDLTRAMDEIVWAVNPKHDTLESLASYLEKFAQDFLELAGIRCRLDVPVQFPEWPLMADVRHNVFLAFKEAVHNAVKHAEASEVRVSLVLKSTGFELSVVDNGRGFSFQPGAKRGNGLDNMVVRMRNLGGRCEIHSEPGQGTRVTFLVPKNFKRKSRK